MKINDVLVEFVTPQAVAQDPGLEREKDVDVIFFGKMPRDYAAETAWAALEEVLPAEYPAGSEKAQEKVKEVAFQGGAVVTTKPLSVAKKLVATFNGYGIKSRINGNLNEFAPSGDGGGSGDYFQALASAWYNGTFDSGSLQKGIKSQQDVEQLLQRGIIGPDGVTRKYGIDYNSTFDGVVISSDDYYEHADHDETDSRTGKPFGPYDYMEFGDEELDEGLTEVDRRGFLKGVGAAAVAGAAGYSANKLINDPSKRWKASAHNYDELDKEYKGKSFSITSSDKKMLLVVEPSTNRVTVIVNRGPEVFNSFSNLRMKIDNNPAETIDNITGVITYFSFNYPADKILDANKISFQIAFLRRDEPGRNPMPGDYRVITFIPGQQNESANQGVAEGLNEFAPDSNDGGGEDDALRNYARMWWAGDEATQMQIERALAKMGWEIGEDEGGYDNGGVFVVRAGDENGNSYQSWAAEDLTEGMSEATGDEKFDTMMGQIQREPKYPDSQMPPTDVKDLYQWAVKNNKPYHKIFAEWANREGYKSVAPALQRAGDLDTEALDYWTPRVWKIYWGEVRGIDSEMPPEWSKKRVPDELRDYLETVFDAYDNIVFDWPTEYRQIGGQDNYAEGASMAEGKPKEKEADYGADYQDMVSRVKKLAGLGPLKTVYDPQKRVYKNVPTAVQPKKEQR